MASSPTSCTRCGTILTVSAVSSESRLGCPNCESATAASSRSQMFVGLAIALAFGGALLMVLVGVVGLGLAVYFGSPRAPAVTSEERVKLPREIRTVVTPADPPAAPPVASPSPSASVPDDASLTDPLANLKYRWNPDFNYSYSFVLKPTMGKLPIEFAGAILYGLEDKASPSFLHQRAAGKLRQGRGLAFVVHSDGLLVTRAQLVRGAARISLFLAGKEYQPTVVAVDDAHDLALLRVSAAGLAPLALADTEKLRLPVDILAVEQASATGTPEALRLLPGSASSRLANQAEKLLEIQAEVGPQSGGGPVFNMRGEVLGLSNAGFAGERVTSPSFAIEAAYISKLLRKQGISTATSSAPSLLTVEELQARAATSIGVLIADREDSGALLSLSGLGGYHFGNNSGNQVGLGPKDGHEHASRVLMTPSGHVLESVSSLALPFVLPPLPEMMIVPLPDGSGKSGEVCRLVALEIAPKIGPDAIAFPPAAYRRVILGPAPKPANGAKPGLDAAPTATILPAVERLKYRLISETNETFALEQGIELISLQRDGEKPQLQLAGKATIVWDKGLGALKSLDQSATLIAKSGAVRSVVPLQLNVTLRDATPYEVTTEPFEKPAQRAPGEAPRTMTALLKDLASALPHERERAMHEMADVGGRREIATAIAKELTSPQHRTLATAALSEMGPVAEDAVWPHMRSPDQVLFSCACQALGAVGTHKSLLRASLLPDQTNDYRRTLLKRASERIEQRLAAE